MSWNQTHNSNSYSTNSKYFFLFYKLKKLSSFHLLHDYKYLYNSDDNFYFKFKLKLRLKRQCSHHCGIYLNSEFSNPDVNLTSKLNKSKSINYKNTKRGHNMIWLILIPQLFC